MADQNGETPREESNRRSGRTGELVTVRRVVSVVAFAFVIHVFVVPQIGGARKALSVLGSLNPILIAIAIVLETAAFVSYARLTQLLIPADNRPGLGVSFGTVMASTGISHVVPGGIATTGAVNYRLLGDAGVPADELGFALGTQAIGSAVVLNVLLWAALVVSIPTSGFQPIYATAAAVGAVVIVVFAIGVMTMLRGREAFASRVAHVAGRVPKLSEQSVEETMLKLADQVSGLADDRDRLRLVIGFAGANWLLDAAALWVMLSAFGHRPGVVGLLVAYGLANVMAAIPVSPGGLGVIEAVLIPTLVGFGTPRAEAAIGVVAYRVINFWLPIPVGAVSYVAVERFNQTRTRRGFVGEVDRQLKQRFGDATAEPDETS
jgi:uncharacterized protein (TIRG00374 family)